MSTLNRKSIMTVLALGLLLTGFVAVGIAAMQKPAPEMSRAYLHSYNLPSAGLALEGYCPVSYFTENEARPGKPEYTSTHNSVDYHFASAEAKSLFDQNPEKYIPAYGGWCAYGMAVRDKFPIDPTNFKIVDGRLMVFLRNRNVDALALWNQNDEQEQIAIAEAYWKKVSQ